MPRPAGPPCHRPVPLRSFAAFASRLACAALVLVLGAPRPTDAASVQGRATDPDGAAVVGVQVRLVSTAREFTTNTGPDGTFALDLPAGTYRLFVLCPGLRAAPRDVVLTTDASVTIDLPLQISAVTETIVVSAAQADGPLSATPASVTVVSGDDLAARQVHTLSDALRAVPGFSVATSGSGGALTSVFPRGGESDYTLVLLDGIRLNSFGGGMDFATLASASVDRIEVVRGPQSAVYGADAIGGVVQVITRQDGQSRVAGTVAGGSADTAFGSASVGSQVGRWSWGAGGEGLRSDNWNGQRLASGAVVANDDTARWSAMASLGVGGPRGRGRAVIHRGSTERGYPGPFGRDPNGTFPGLDTVSRGWNDWLAGGASGEATWSKINLAASGTWTRLDSRFDSPYGTSHTSTRRADGRVQANVPLTANVSASTGVEWLGEEARSTYITGASFQPVPVSRDVLGAFGELRLEVLNRVTLTGGARVDRIRRDRLEPSPDPFSPRPAFADDVVTSVNPRVAGSWFARSPVDRRGWTRVHASAGTGIRPPDAFEIAFTDNPWLRPERSRSADAGVEQAFAGGAVIVDATAFRNEYDDLIVAVGRSFADASQYRTDNIANARARGLELSASYRSARGLQLRAAYYWLDAKVLAVDGQSGAAPAPFAPGDPLIRRPPHQGWVDALYATPRWSAFARTDFRGEIVDVDPTYGAFGGMVRGPGFGVVNVGGSVRVRSSIEVIARVSNLLDRRYEEVVGFPALGRAVTVGVRLAAGR